MGKLKPDRKPACSAKSIDRIFAIVSENWDEVWAVVQARAQVNKAIHRQQLRNLRSKSFTH